MRFKMRCKRFAVKLSSSWGHFRQADGLPKVTKAFLCGSTQCGFLGAPGLHRFTMVYYISSPGLLWFTTRFTMVYYISVLSPGNFPDL